MAMKDLAHSLHIDKLTSGTAFDIQGFNSVTIVVTGDGATGETTIGISHSDDNSTFTDVGELDTTSAIPKVTNAAPVQKVGYIGAKRYVKVTLSGDGSATATAQAILGRPDLMPTA